MPLSNMLIFQSVYHKPHPVLDCARGHVRIVVGWEIVAANIFDFQLLVSNKTGLP